MDISEEELMARKAAEKRCEKYQAILLKYNNKLAIPLDKVVKEIAKELLKHQVDTIERLAGTFWHVLIMELDGIDRDLVNDESRLIVERQRRCYATLRFCMEIVADLLYLKEHPKELENFLTDKELIAAEIDELRTANMGYEERDAKIAALSLKGKINSRITDRIANTFPGYTQEYALFCMQTHLSMQGLEIFLAWDATDLLFEKVAKITEITMWRLFIILDSLNMITPRAEREFRRVYKGLIECHREVNNLYYGKDRSVRITTSHTDEKYRVFCHRKELFAKHAKAKRCQEPENAGRES